MIRKYIRVDTRVSAISFTGQKIIGNYRGPCANFGVWIYGSPEKELTISSLHKCLSLSMESLDKKKKIPSTVPFKFSAGDPVTGKTAEGQRVTGKFMQIAGPKYSFIKGKFLGLQTDDNQAIKVLRTSVKKA